MASDPGEPLAAEASRARERRGPARVLWIGTKPPLPPVDGGRLLTAETIRALSGLGVEVSLVAPCPGRQVEADAAAVELRAFARPYLVPIRPRSPLVAFFSSLAVGPPYSIWRHRLDPVRSQVAALLESAAFDVVHVEQLQAFPQAAPALARGVPVVLRAQNVECDIWAAATAARPLAGLWLGGQARRLAAWEGSAIRRASATVALTEEDGARLAALAGGARILVVPAPFPAQLAPGTAPLEGAPALVIVGSAGWFPNEDAADWFTGEAWPVVRRRVPGAKLHLFDGRRGFWRGAEIVVHPPPVESRAAFAPGSVLLVPLRIGSGVRMKILEAWARGVPVVATPTAAAGLGAEDGRELLLASDGEGFARAVARLSAEPALAEALTAGGRRLLAERHDPAASARLLIEVYRRAAGGGAGAAALAS